MLLLLGAISLAPFVGSLLLYYFWKPQSFTNYGELIAVVPLAGTTIPARDGKPFRMDELRGNWILLMADSGNCDDNCQSKLYVMRQIRLTQGKDRERIERVWLIPDGSAAAAGRRSRISGNTHHPARHRRFSRTPAGARFAA